MITDTVQMVIFLFGGLLGTGLSLRLVGGLSGLFQILEGRNLGYMTHMVRSVNDRDYPWYENQSTIVVAHLQLACIYHC